MPGSTITSILNAPYLTAWGVGVPSNNVGAFTVASHPFTTGDVIYVKLFINAALQTTQSKYFVIVDSPTQLRYASSYENAISGTALAIPQGLTTGQSSLRNTPVGSTGFNQYAMHYHPSTWMSSSRAVISFSPTSNVNIDFTLNDNSHKAAVIHTQTLGAANSYIFGFDSSSSGIFQASGANSTAVSAPPININFLLSNPSIVSPIIGRFTIQDSRVSLSVKLNDGSYLTAFTSNTIPVSTAPLFFSVCMGLNNQNFNDCTITYF